MDAIIFNNQPSRIHQRTESVALRACYLVCDSILAAGTSCENIWYSDMMQKLNYTQKIQIIEAHYKNTDNPLVEAGQFISLWKQTQKVKYKNPKQIVMLKKFEAAIDTLYKKILAEMKEGVDRTGLPELKGLVDGKSIGFIGMLQANLESEENNANPASKLLKGELPEEEDKTPRNTNERAIFCLTPEFFIEALSANRKIYTYRDEEAKDITNCWLHKCFTFPNINLLSAIELQSIRKLLEPVSAEFKKQADAWIKICDEPGTGDTLALFQKNVLPHTASLQAAIAQADLIKHIYTSQRSDANLELWMGEIPVEVFWQFYKTFEVIHDATWNILSQALQNETKWKKRVPVMALRVPVPENYQPPETETASQETPEVKSVRKSITVD